MSTTPNEPEKVEAPKEKKRTFSSATGDKVRAEHRRVGLIGTLVAGALGGGAYGIHRSAEKFLPTETRKALEETERVFNRMRMSRALSGSKADSDDVIENYATQASRLASANVAGMQGRELVKLLRSKLPVQNKWQPFFSDAHYDAFARGPAYGAAQLIDEHAVSMVNRPGVAKKLKQYLVDKWPEKYSDKVNATALAIAGKKMDVGPSLRESLAYGGDTIATDKQPAIVKEIIRGSLFNKDRIPVFGGFSDHYKDLKKDLANGLMGSSFPNYIGLGHKAKGVHSALKYALPALVGAAGVGVGGYGLLKLIKSMKRTPYEKRMIEKAEREGEKSDKDAEPEKSATVFNSIRKLIDLQPKIRRIASYTRAPQKFEDLDKDIHDLLIDDGVSYPGITPDTNNTVSQLDTTPNVNNAISALGRKLGLINYSAAPNPATQPMSKNAGVLARLRKARNVTHTHPTPAQAHEGNYRKGAFKFHGIKIKIENPKDTTRRGYKDGKEIWSRVMNADYGYFHGTKAIDGDAVDCFIGPNLDSELVVAVDQYKGDKFDETKFVLGVDSQSEGEKLYLAHYPKGWALGPVSTCTIQQLKVWLKNGNHKTPFSNQRVKSAKDYSRLLHNLRVRRGECPQCGTPDQPPHQPCTCTQDKSASDNMNDEPSTIGKGFGTLFSDFFPYAPSGARRAGAASLMAKRIGEDPGILLKYPMLSQVLSMMAGGALAGATAQNTGNPGGSALVGIAPWLALQGLRRSKINSVAKRYKEKARKRLREIDAEEMVDDAMGSHRLGMAQAHEAMRTRKYRDLGSIAEAADALPVATSMMGLGAAASLPFTQLIDQLESRKFINKSAAKWDKMLRAGKISGRGLFDKLVGQKNLFDYGDESKAIVDSVFNAAPAGTLGLMEAPLAASHLGDDAGALIKKMRGFSNVSPNQHLDGPWGLHKSVNLLRRMRTAKPHLAAELGVAQSSSLQSAARPIRTTPTVSRRSAMSADYSANGHHINIPDIPNTNFRATRRHEGGHAIAAVTPFYRRLQNLLSGQKYLTKNAPGTSALLQAAPDRPRLLYELEAHFNATKGRNAGPRSVLNEVLPSNDARITPLLDEALRLDPSRRSAQMAKQLLHNYSMGAKSASLHKKADFSDQINGPAIPMYLAAAGLGTAGLIAAGKKLHKDLNDPNLKNMPRGEWDGLAKHISRRDLLSAEVPGLSNAFFARAKNDAEAQGLLRYIALHDPVVRKKISILDPTLKNLRKQVQEHGIIAFDPTFGKASVVGHEAGHGKIEHTPGLMQSLQRNLYQYSPLIAPLSAVGGMAAGLATKNTLGGLLAGTGIGLLGGAGMMFPEYMATHHGMQGLKTYKGGKFAQPGDWGRQLTALGTYGALNVLPAALSGAFGGYIGGRRKKRREQAEANLEEPDNVIRMDEDSRKVEKAANLAQRFQQIQKLKIQAKALGSDYADKSALKQLGGYLKPSINQFFNNKEVQQLGIKKGMKPTKILDILRNVSGSQS